MPNRKIFSRFALIGENLDLKQNVNLDISQEGKIKEIEYDEVNITLDLNHPKDLNFILIPGFINSHVHICDNFAKELGFNKNLIDIVEPPNGLKHKLLAETPDKIKINGIKNAVLEMLSNGITCFIDFRERGIEGLALLNKALQNSPISYLALGRSNIEEEIISIVKSSDGIGLANYNVISKEIKEKLKELKSKYKKLVACHIAELNRENAILKEILNDNIVDIVIHGTHLTLEDLEKIENKKIRLVLCPRSNGYFGTGFPPIKEIFSLNLPISLGTDNLMAISPDLFEEMRYLYMVSRFKERDLQISGKKLLKMVTINAARNFNLDQDCGSISEGKNADFFLIDLNSPNYYSIIQKPNSLYPLLIQRTKSYNIKKTFIKGECVFERN